MIIKVGLIGIIAVLVGMIFKSVKPEYGIYIGLVAMLLISGVVVQYLMQALSEFQGLEAYLDTGGAYLTVLIKMVGITYICECAGAVCKDAGYQALSGQIDIFGKLCVIMTGFPIVHALFDMIGGFL